MAELVLQALYLFLPAYAANMAPVIAKRLRLFSALDRPLDGGAVLHGQPLFGPHKTLRGFVVGISAAIVVAVFQRWAATRAGLFQEVSLPPHTTLSPLLWGGLLGGGALLGDLVKSFVKRRRGIPPGRRWFPWDQLDLVFGAVVLGSIVYTVPLPLILIVLLATPLLGLLVNLGGYLLSVKEAW